MEIVLCYLQKELYEQNLCLRALKNKDCNIKDDVKEGLIKSHEQTITSIEKAIIILSKEK